MPPRKTPSRMQRPRNLAPKPARIVYHALPDGTCRKCKCYKARCYTRTRKGRPLKVYVCPYCKNRVFDEVFGRIDMFDRAYQGGRADGNSR